MSNNYNLNVQGQITSYNNLTGLQLVSTISNGTTPIIVTSSNLVSNLNVQYLNNQLGSYYTNANNFSSGILGVTYGGTGVSSMTSGYIHYGSGGILGQSSNLFFNSTSNYMGIGTSNPIATIHAVGNILSTSNISSSNQFINSVATGTAPLSVVSTTLVSNLNVQYLNGQLATYYTNASNISSGILQGSYGGTGISTITPGYVYFGSSSNTMAQSSNLFFNSTSNYLGIGISNPTSALHVLGNILSTSNIISSNQFINSVAAGTAPFSVNSTTMVCNLNVQYLNSQTGTYYTNASNINSGILAASYGGTGVSTITNGYVQFGSSSNTIAQSSNLFYNSTSNYLGIGISNPTSSLHVVGNILSTSNITSSNQFVSSIVTGTAPFSVTSTTIVSNLNVQYLNSQLGTYYTNASNISSGILAGQFGGTGVSTMSAGYVHFGSSSNTMAQSSNLFFNSTSNYLGVGVPTPTQALHVAGNILSTSNITSSNQFVNLVASGIAPLSINSTTIVSNLNVQYLNGQLGTYYTNASNISSGILSASYGGTGVSSMTSGQVHFGTSSNTLGQSSNLFFNPTSNFLGIGTSSPLSMLDITAGSNQSLTLRGPPSQQCLFPNVSNGYTEIMYGSIPATTTCAYYMGQGSGNFGTNSFNLVYKQSATQQYQCFTALSNGYMGFGTINPLSLLDINMSGYNYQNGGGVIIRGGSSGKQLQLVPASNGLASEIAFNYMSNSSDYTNLATIGINTSSCGASNLGIAAPGKGLAMTLQYQTGYLGIGTSNPSAPLDIEIAQTNSFSNYGYLSTSGAGKATASYSCPTSMYASGRIVSGIEFEAISDRRQKKNIQSLNTQQQIQFVQKLNPVKFQWRQGLRSTQKQDINCKQSIGFIAQDILKTEINYEELVNVRDNPDMKEEQENCEHFKSLPNVEYSLNYDGFIPILTSVVKHLLDSQQKFQNQLDILQSQVSILKKQQ